MQAMNSCFKLNIDDRDVTLINNKKLKLKFIIYKDTMNEQAPTLKWGDIVRIHGVNRSKKEDSSTKGLIVTKGFTDPNIYYQKYNDFEDINMYRQSLFQILPRSNFDIHDQMLNTPPSSPQIELLKTRAVTELDAFENIIKAKAGKEIQYESEVIFKHVESQSYLRGILKAADTGEGAFKVDVTSHLSTQVVFRITSHRTYEHENDKIYFDDALLIYHPGADCFMNFADTKDKKIFLDKEISKDRTTQVEPEHNFYKYYKDRPSIKKPTHIRGLIVNENKSKCLWKFIQHCTYEEYTTKNKIKSHDIVYFVHTKQNGLVSSTLSKPIKYYLKQKGEGLFYQCFWQLIPKKVNELGPEDCDLFKVRNVITGQILTFSETNFEIEIKPQNESGVLESEGLVHLICSETLEGKNYKLERSEQEEDTLHEGEEDNKIIKEYENKFQLIRFKKVEEMPKDIFKIFKVDNKTLLDLQYALSSHEPLVKIIEIMTAELMYCDRKSNEAERYTAFFRSMQEDYLINIITILKMLIGKIYNVPYEKIRGSGISPDKNIQKILVETGIVQLVIEIINTLYKPFLYIEAMTESSSEKAIINKISEIFEYSYRLLENVAINNEENRTYISRWVDLFLDHSNNINQPYIQECLVGILQNNPVSIEATINRQKIKQLISSFFREAQKVSGDTPLTTKFLRLFSTFIVCDNRVIKENQHYILDDFFKNTDNEQIFRVKLELKPDYQEDSNDPLNLQAREVLIAFGKQQYTTIPKFFNNWNSKWNYFIAYINLLADVCLDRNMEAIKNVSALLSLQMVATILFDPEIKKLNDEIRQANKQSIANHGHPKYPVTNVHEPFIRIAHNLYINNDKFDPVKRIKKISRWYRNEEIEGPIVEDINTTKRVFQGEKEEEQKYYLKNILIYIKEFLKNASQEPEDLSMVYTVLDLLKTTIRLGLWTSINQFRELIPLIILRITKIDSKHFFDVDPAEKDKHIPSEYVNNKKKMLKQNKPEITKIIQCKNKATEIFTEINEFEIDIRLRYIMNFFKGLYETTQDFNAYDVPIPDVVYSEETEKEKKERNEFAKKQFFKMDTKAILGDNIKKVSEDQQILLKTNVWFSKLKAMTPFEYDPNVSGSVDRFLFQGGVEAPSNGDIKEAMEQNFKVIILALLELPIYENYKLLNSSLKMLRCIFEQRTALIDNFRSILICGKGNLQQVYLTLKFMRNKFQMLTNPNIQKYQGQQSTFSYALWKPYDSLVKAQDKRSGIIQDLFFLSRTLKDNISLKNIESLMRVEQDAFDKHKVNGFIDERQKNNVLFQALNIAEEIYIPLMEYIKIMSHFQINTQSIHYKLLKSIYQYLTLVCFNNLQAKQLMIQYIPFVLHHMDKHVGAPSFLYVVAYNNKTLINDEQLVTSIIEACLNACVSMKQVQSNQITKTNKNESKVILSDAYDQSEIFIALRGILIFNESGHHRNQEILMNKLQQNRYTNLIHSKVVKESRGAAIDNFDLNTELSYIATHFEMFSSLVESGNMINIGKLENIHPYTYCLEYLRSTNRWQIRRTMRAYINRLYYVNKDKDIFLFEEFIRKEFDIINGELHDLVDLHVKKAITIDTVIKNGIRFKYAVSEIMVFIIEILISLHEIFLKPEFKKVLEREIFKEEKYPESSRPLHEKLIKLYRYIGSINKLYPETKIIFSFIREISKLMREVLKKLQIKYLESKSAPDLGETPALEIDEIGSEVEKKSYVYDYSKSYFRNLTNMIRDVKAQQKLEKLKEEFKRREKKGEETEQEAINRCLDNIFIGTEKLMPVHAKKKRKGPAYLNAYLQTTSSTTFKVLAKPEISENQENIQLNNQLATVKRKMEQSPEFQKFREEEFIRLVSIFSQIDDTSKKFYATGWDYFGEKPSPVLKMTEIIEIIFRLMIREPSAVCDKEKIFVVKLIRCYITEALEQKQDYKLSIDKWDEDYCTQENEAEARKFPDRQELIERCGGSDFIISILSEDLGNRIELLNETLLLGIAYLYGGNEKCQNSILNSLRSDKDNLMLLNIKKLINRIGDSLIEVRANREKDNKRVFSYNIVDTYDYFSVEDHTILKHFGHNKNDRFEMQGEVNNEKALCRIFRFLQLFCENNNIDMKKFLYEQTNEDGNRKTNSVNFIEEACLMLRKFFKIMNNKVVSIPNNLLAFIGEITQLPCTENQISFMKSTFFEDISYLASFFQEINNKKQRVFNQVAEGEDDPLNTLLQIYEQGVQLALSNFEGNDENIFNEFVNKCNPKYLWIVMRNNIWFLLKEDYEDMGVVENSEDCRLAMKQTLDSLDLKSIEELIRRENKRGMMFEGRLLMILNILSIIKRLEDYAATAGSQQADKAKCFRLEFLKTAEEEYVHIADFMKQFEGLLLHIEVSTPKNQNIYFPKHPSFNYLSGETRDYIMMEVSRDTRRDKLITLTNFQQTITSEIESNYELNYNIFKTPLKTLEYPITSELCNKVRTYARNCSYVICILLIFLVFVDHDTEEMSSEFSYNNFVAEVVVKTVCLIQLGLTLLYCYLWGKMRAKLALRKYHEIEIEDAGIYLEPYEQAGVEKSAEGWVVVYENYSKVAGRFSDVVGRLKGYVVESYIWKNIFEPVVALQQTEAGFNSLALFVIASLLGNFYGVQWFALHIFDYFAYIPLLANVFKAILNNIKILVMFSLLAAAFILVFNILSFRTYISVIYEEDLPSEACETIMDCVLQLYTSGAIGDDMEDFEPRRFSFDIVYIVFMELLFSNLVGGIMTDAFGELKEKDKERDEDKSEQCYICSISKADMEKNGETFETHKQRHFLWNYIFYIYCLKKKNQTEYTGIEYLINNQLEGEDISWFPVAEEDDSGGEIAQAILKLKEHILAAKQGRSEFIQERVRSITQELPGRR